MALNCPQGPLRASFALPPRNRWYSRLVIATDLQFGCDLRPFPHELRSFPCRHGLDVLAPREEAAHSLICNHCFDSSSHNLPHRLRLPRGRLNSVLVDEPSVATRLFGMDLTHELPRASSLQPTFSAFSSLHGDRF